MKKRDFHFDLLKALAIFMVVVCHVIDTEVISNYRGGRIASFIWGVNMPLFFVISGYFGVDAIASGRKTACRCFKFLKNMLFYSLVLAVVLYGLGACDTLYLAFKRIITMPLFGWWFMWSLMFSMIVAWVGVRVRQLLPSGAWITFSGFSVLYLTLLIVPDAWWQIKYFKYCFPFFVLGLWIRKRVHILAISRFAITAIWIVAILFYGVFVTFYSSFPVAFYWGDFNFCSVFSSMMNFGTFLLRYVVAIFGILALSIPLFALRDNKFTRTVAELGTTTMGVYFLHQTILRHILVPVYHGARSLPALMLLALILWLACHVLVFFLVRHNSTKKLFC